MTENRTVFEHTDEDGDRLQVTRWTNSGPNEPRPNLVFKVTDHVNDELCVASRLHPDQVRSLVSCLTVWLELVAGSETGDEPEPEPRTVYPALDPVRAKALELAVAFGQYASENQHVDVREVAEEFENYLRFGRQVEPEFEPETLPEPPPPGYCLQCGHRLADHNERGCRVGHPETSTGWRNDNACGCTNTRESQS